MNTILLKIGVICFSINFWVSTEAPIFQDNLSSKELLENGYLASIQKAPLTEDKILKFMKSRMATFKLQSRMKAQADKYDNLIQEFYKRRKVLLQKQGWDVEDFEKTESRIYSAINALEKEASLKSDADFKKEIAEVKSNNYLSQKQKSETIELLKLDRKNVYNTFIKPYKLDWPAVKTYKSKLEHLTNYINGSRSDAPVLE